MNNGIAMVFGVTILSTTGAFAQTVDPSVIQALPPENIRSESSSPPIGATPVRSFDEAADECFKFADDRSEWAASQAPDYDGDSLGGAIGSGLSLSIERKRLRKKIYVSCMEGNGFPKAKLMKSKPKT